MSASPVCFIIEDGGQGIAKSSRVLLTKGRRYPGVEHWFVLPEEGHPGEVTDAGRLSYPVEISAAAGLKRTRRPAYGASVDQIVHRVTTRTRHPESTHLKPR